MAVMRGHDDISSDVINLSVISVNPRVDFENYCCLQFFPSVTSGLATDSVNSVMRILSVCLIYTGDLNIDPQPPGKQNSSLRTMELLEEHYICQ